MVKAKSCWNDSAARVATPDANTHGQTGIAALRARSRRPANMEAVAKKVGQKRAGSRTGTAGFRFDQRVGT